MRMHFAEVLVEAEHLDDVPKAAGGMTERPTEDAPDEPAGRLPLPPVVTDDSEESSQVVQPDRFGAVGHVVEAPQVAQQPLGERLRGVEPAVKGLLAAAE